MNKTIYIFSKLSLESCESIAKQLEDAGKEDKPSSTIDLIYGADLPEFGKRVTVEKIEDITFAEFIQDLLKYGQGKKPL